MKILLISSSPHKEKSRTFILAKQVLLPLSDKKAEIEIIHLLDDLRIGFCKHCEVCHRKILHCSVEDDVLAIMKKMLEADGIIFATLDYINQVTASMKALFDRAAHFIHCKRLLGNYVTGVVSSGSGYDKPVLDYIKFCSHTCGAQYSGGVSTAGHALEEKTAEAHELGCRLVSDIQDKKIYPEQIKIIDSGKGHFKQVIQMRKDDWVEEYQYWKDKGWL